MVRITLDELLFREEVELVKSKYKIDLIKLHFINLKISKSKLVMEVDLKFCYFAVSFA